MLDTIVYHLLNMTILATAVFLIVLLIRIIGNRKFSKNLMFLLWVFVLIRMLLPFTFVSEFSFVSFMKDQVKSVPVDQVIPIKTGEEILQPREDELFELTTSNVMQEASQYQPIEYKNELFEKGLKMFSWVWLVGFLLVVLWWTVSNYLFRKSIEHTKLSRETEKESIVYSAKINSPMVYGVFKPVILLPKNIDNDLKEMVLIHEKTHINRKDNLWKILYMTAAAIHWFNPVSWIVLNQVNKDIELACDESVIKHMSDKSRKEYALSLIDAKEKIGQYRTAFSGGSLEHRIESITSFEKLSGKMAMLLILFYLLMALILLTNGCTKPISTKDDSTDENQTQQADSNKYSQGEVYNSQKILYCHYTMSQKKIEIEMPMIISSTKSSTIKPEDMIPVSPISTGAEDSYIETSDIKTYIIDELNISIPSRSRPEIIKVSDGYVLAVEEYIQDKTYLNHTTVFYLIKINFEGNVLWEKVFDEGYRSAYLTGLASFSNGDLLFSIRKNIDLTYESNEVNDAQLNNTWIYKCNKMGELLWKKSYKDNLEHHVEELIVTEKDEIVIIGEISSKDRFLNPITTETQEVEENKTNESDRFHTDVVVYKLDFNGEIIQSLRIPGEENDSVRSACYLEGKGFVITGDTRSLEGPLARLGRSVEEKRNDYLAFINEDLQIQWVLQTELDERFTYESLYTSNTGIYIGGSINKTDMVERLLSPTDVLIEQENFVRHYDYNGNLLEEYHGEKTLCGDTWIAPQTSGDIVMGSGNINQGHMTLFRKGEVVRTVTLDYDLLELYGRPEGGYILKGMKTKGSIPQPIYISSIWFDVEMVVAGYDSELNLVWQKGYDEYKESKDVDQVYILD